MCSDVSPDHVILGEDTAAVAEFTDEQHAVAFG
jgi:hypothetical protein